MGEKIMDKLLYRTRRSQYTKIRETAGQIGSQYAMGRIRDDIFSVMQLFCEKNGAPLELFRFPVEDVRFYACCALREKTIFCMVNTAVPLGMQVFAAAHELYRIQAYVSGKTRALLTGGSLYAGWQEKRDAEACAFAAALLAPEPEIVVCMERYAMEKNSVSVQEAVRLSDNFGIPYRAMVLRLFECSLIERQRTSVLLGRTADAKQYVRESGIGLRWLLPSRELLQFGSLPLLMRENEERGRFPQEALWEERVRLEELKKRLTEQFRV